MNETGVRPEEPRKRVEEWAQAKSTIDWQFAAAQAGHRWAIGTELTEAEYDAAIQRAAHVSMR